MAKNYSRKELKKIHFIGIGGVSMSALSLHLKNLGYEVSGSDSTESLTLQSLRKKGIKVYDRHRSSNVNNVDAVCYTSAISLNNCELKKAIKKKLPIYKRSEVLGKILSKFDNSIGVSGCHGKTTATAMIADALIVANKNPTVFLGGENKNFGNYLMGDEKICLAEACEFKKNFLDIKPKISVVLNIDKDHMDSYDDESDLISAYSQFVVGSISVINADDPLCEKIHNSTSVSFGINILATYSARNVKFNGIGYTFTAYAYSMKLGTVKLSVIGKHNVYNALATIAVCDLLKIPFSKVKLALENFTGVKRRAEYLGSVNNLDYYADYAHHPKEIMATVKAFSYLDKPMTVVFQPHTYSRTKYLMQEFIDALKEIDNLIIYSTYPAREKFDLLGDAKTLYQNLKKEKDCFYAFNEKELANRIKEISIDNACVLFLGAGDIYDIAKKLLNETDKANKK